MKWMQAWFIFFAGFMMSAQALAVGAGITYHGRLIDPNGNPVVGNAVQFKVQLRTPGNENCLMYEEVQIKDLSQTDGVFSVTVNDGTGTRLDSSGYGLDQIFANRGSFTFAGGQCASGTTYNTSPTDGRRIQVLFNDGTFAAGTWEPVPAVPINFVPMAIEAMQVGGYKKEQLIKLADGVSTTGSELNGTSWANLLALIAGTSTQYVTPGAATFTAAPIWSGTPSGANDLTNKAYVDAQVAAGLPNVGTAGTYTKVTTDAKGRVTSGSNPTTLAGYGITDGVTSVSSANSDISVANGASTPVLTLNSGTGNNQIVKLDGSAKLPAVDGSALTNLNAGNIASGTLPVGRGGTGATTFGNNGVVISNGTGSSLQTLNCTNTQVITFDVSGYAVCGSSSGLPAVAGTAAAPGYAFSGNTNTGIFSPGTNQIALSNNGTESVRIDASGRVGIGTTTPIKMLHISKDNPDPGAEGIFIQTSTTNALWYPSAIVGRTTRGTVANPASNVDTELALSIMAEGYAAGNGWGKLATINLGVDGTPGFLSYPGFIGFNTTPVNGTDSTERMRITNAGKVGIGTQAPAEQLDVNGAVKVGTTANACSATNKGSIRYNNATSVLEFCNGASWNLIQAAACSDATPDSFSFTNEANATVSTQYSSDIVQVGGINCVVPVTISGAGSPQFQICSDAGCGSVIQGWTSSPSSITSGQYLQVRLTTDGVGGSNFQATVIVGGTASVWSVTNAGGDCTASPTPGTVCADGTIYAGLSPDGNVKMFTTRCDAGQTWDGVSSCTGARSAVTWNNGTTNGNTTTVYSAITGQANSATLDGLSDSGAPYSAAQYCESLNLNGHTDWYLPAISEVAVLYSNMGAIRNFYSTGTYWSSSQVNNTTATYFQMASGTADSFFMYNGRFVRCVRR